MRRSSVLIVALAALLVIGGASIRRSTALKAGFMVAVLGAVPDPSYLTNVQTYLVSFSDVAVVDTFDVHSSTPSLLTLLDYDAVLVFSDTGFLNATALGDVLADYVDVGGGVVLATFDWFEGVDLEGRMMTEYSPFVLAGESLYSRANMSTYNAAHPIMAGVSNVSEFYRDDVNLTAGAELVAEWSDGHPFVATKGRVVGMTLYPPPLTWTGDVPTLVHNALVWSVSDPALELVPSSGFASITIVGSGGFAGNARINVTWDGTPIPTVPQTIITDVHGNFTAIISVPTPSAHGQHLVNATDQFGRSGWMSFTVTDLTGPTGPTGLTGAQGSQGLQGAQGETGPAGTVPVEYVALLAVPGIVAIVLAVYAVFKTRPRKP